MAGDLAPSSPRAGSPPLVQVSSYRPDGRELKKKKVLSKLNCNVLVSQAFFSGFRLAARGTILLIHELVTNS